MDRKELATKIYQMMRDKNITKEPRPYFIRSVLYGTKTKPAKTKGQLQDWLSHLEAIYK